MKTWKAATPLLIVLGLAACAPQPPGLVQLGPAQYVPASNTMLGGACDGHDHTANLHLIGDSLLNVTVRLDEIAGGTVRPFGQGAVPVDFASQSLPQPVFLRGAPGAACTGVAVRAKLRHDYAYQGRIFLDYVLEVAPDAPAVAELPAAPWRVKGSFEVISGQGTDDVRFGAGAHALIAHVSAAPGTGWREMLIQRAARKADDLAYPTYARPLPDELPGRTLDDALNPAYSNGASNPLLHLQDNRVNGAAPGTVSPSFVR